MFPLLLSILPAYPTIIFLIISPRPLHKLLVLEFLLQGLRIYPKTNNVSLAGTKSCRWDELGIFGEHKCSKMARGLKV